MNKNEMITIEAEYVRESAKSIYLDCEGDLEWFPKSKVEHDKKTNSLKAPKWLLMSKFPETKW